MVLGGHTRVKDPHANFQDAFKGSGSGGRYGATTALYDIIFSYAGYTNAFNVVNKVKKPVQTIKKSAALALLLVAILYILANVAYLAAVPKAALAAGKQTVASLFFEEVFGSNEKGLNILIAISAFGSIIAVFIGQSHVIRECGRYVSSSQESTFYEVAILTKFLGKESSPTPNFGLQLVLSELPLVHTQSNGA